MKKDSLLEKIKKDQESHNKQFPPQKSEETLEAERNQREREKPFFRPLSDDDKVAGWNFVVQVMLPIGLVVLVLTWLSDL
jgi:hypothetical protein|tara:strand:+ start:717 stop:956 length:240 start_codon:yes stop_codon:yes gene_type:complete